MSVVSSAVGIWYTAWGCEEGRQLGRSSDSSMENNGAPYFSELIGQEQRLKQRVHVARRALVLEPDVTRLLLRIVAAQGDEPRGQWFEMANKQRNGKDRTCGSCATRRPSRL